MNASDNLQISEVVRPQTVFSFDTKYQEPGSSPSSTVQKNLPVSSPSPSRQQKKRSPDDSPDATLSSPSLPLSIAKSSTVKIDKDARALNLNLEQCLLMTLRQEGASGQVIFMGKPGDKNELVNASNMVELICSRLSGKSDILNAINYLYGCYKRIQAKEVASVDKLREDLAK